MLAMISGKVDSPNVHDICNDGTINNSYRPSDLLRLDKAQVYLAHYVNKCNTLPWGRPPPMWQRCDHPTWRVPGWWMCPANFHFVLVTYWAMFVTLVLCLMMVLWILSFSLTLIIFLPMGFWLVSSFLANNFVRDNVWHPYIIAGKTLV